ncbi:hypothetical protein FDH01_gp162 [Acinetobacter phage vB_AbaM_ME3]|uniref:Uncharacterized protein n=1 Tax=Acinetobacter phage vB_AbaM_ME3 TaxID=1837876 RepID=A0A172Q0R7_9CAUD|nr:hypothetical protein FDH01_gp162 [Acinetobacter phage vB_AbaM_ME3]AND75460.1 hypothetical protein ME3_299 [Acinetobacter phage vB_AbaM_ME3]
MKSLYLRIDCSKYSKTVLENIKDFFLKFYKEVFIYNIHEQKEVLLGLVKDFPEKTFVSIDKFITLDHNIDVSRVHDIEGNYLHHVIKYDGRKYNNNNIVLYDHDIVNGIGFNLVKTLLESQGCTVETFSFLNISPDEMNENEILDFDDFLTSGLVVQIADFLPNIYYLSRFKYHQNKEILYKKASIYFDDYRRFCLEFKSLLDLNSIGVTHK